MKFTTPILAFVAASTVCASHITKLNKRTNAQCEAEIKVIKECIQTPTLNTLDYMCKKYESEECQKFYADPMSIIPSCKNDTFYTRYFQPLTIGNTKQQFNLVCIKDEAGNQCPFGEFLLKEYSNLANPVSSEQREELRKSSCRSKICREATYKAFFDYEAAFAVWASLRAEIGVEEDTSVYVGKQEAAKYMDTEECKAMSGASMSGVSTLKIGTGFLISIGLLLLSLY